MRLRLRERWRLFIYNWIKAPAEMTSMTTSASHTFLYEIVTGLPIALDRIAFFRARTQSHLYDLVVGKFLELERDGKITRAGLGRRIGKSPAQISRLLGSPGNWTTDTTSDLLLGMGEELEPRSCPLTGIQHRNYECPEWVQLESAPISRVAANADSAPNTATVTNYADHRVRIASTA